MPLPTTATREELVAHVLRVGQAVNALRLALVQKNYPFIGGMMRGAEDITQLVYATLGDNGIPENEL